ncbi:MAG TPA: HNH endonuclease signature motif containing protein [Vicinamibacteria bacterium]|nr:HNH endonuclease signature motif containing protein [Vicinamibacteria bacterium]
MAPVAEEADALLDRLEAAYEAGRRGIERTDALALHAIAVAAARGSGAFELAIGEGLDLLLQRGGLARLGASGIGDLARERLGLVEGPARRMRRNAVKLRERPLLRAEIVSGEVTPRKAEVLLDRTSPEEDAYWTARAKAETVRQLETALRKPGEPPEEDWHRIEVALPPEEAIVVRTALDYAGVLVGLDAPYLRRVEVMLWEFLGEFGLDPGESPRERAADVEHPAEADPRGPLPVAADRPPAGAAEPAEEPFVPEEVVAKLRALVRERSGLDERLRRTCLLMRRTGGWAWASFRNFAAWCAEGIGLSPRTVRFLVALERRLQELPPLREAVRSGLLSPEHARQVGRHATLGNVEARIAEAVARPVIDTRRDADDEAERQMWNTATLKLSLPDRVEELLRDALHAGRAHFGLLDPGKIIVLVAAHCTFTWREEVRRLERAANPVMVRDRWRCQVPGCSKPAEHIHHVRWRSRGGTNDRWNLVALCEAHHLAGVHAGYIEIEGTAPDGLTWIVGEEAVKRARAERRRVK